ERISERVVLDPNTSEEGVRPAPSAVNQLIRDEEGARSQSRGETADRGGSNDGVDSEMSERPQIRPIVDLVRRESMTGAVPRQECDRASGELADRDRSRRLSVRRIDLDR